MKIYAFLISPKRLSFHGQNDITSPELLRQVNPDNMRLKQDFLDYLRSVQRSPKTIAGYDNDEDFRGHLVAGAGFEPATHGL